MYAPCGNKNINSLAKYALRRYGFQGNPNGNASSTAWTAVVYSMQRLSHFIELEQSQYA